MKKIIILFSFLVVLSLFTLPFSTGANSGVSINTGKILLEKAIVPGGTYDLPSVEVKNTGDESSDYGVSVEYNEVQSQLKPEAKWFEFSPINFNLLPGESKIVKTKIIVPENAQAGDYFAYIEAHTLNNKAVNNLSISGAAASKLYFSVDKFNIFKTIYFSSLSYVKKYSPISYIPLAAIFVIILYFIVRNLKLIIKSKKN